MKKIILILFGAALMLVGCGKVENEVVVPENGKHIVTLKATIDNADTKVSADAEGNFSWQAGDKIVVLTKLGGEDSWENGTTENTGTTASFDVELEEGETLGDYAFYPAAEGCGISSEEEIEFGLNSEYNYVEGATNMPMLGTISSDGISFKSVGGVLKLTINNIPEDAAMFQFSVNDMCISDNSFIVSDGKISAIPQEGSSYITMDFTGQRKSSMVFYIPLPTGTYEGFELSFMTANRSDVEGVATKTTGITLGVERNAIIVAPTLDWPSDTPSYAGEWIMVGENEGSYIAALSYVSGNNIKGTDITIENDVVTASDASIKKTFTLVTEGTYQGMYTIQDDKNQYLYAAGGTSNNYLKASASIDTEHSANYYWEITEDGEGGFSIIASKSTSRNILRFNQTNNGPVFACYAVNTQGLAGSNVMLYKWSDAVIETPTCATPTIACSNNVITITSSTDGASIYYEIGATEAATNDPTTSSALYDVSNKPTITADSYVKAIAVAEGYNNSDVAGAAVIYVVPSTEVWTLVTKASDLEDGKQIVITNADGSKALGSTQNTNNRAAVDVSETTGGIAINSDVQIITLEKSGSNWYLNVGENAYLYAASNSSNHLKTSTKTTVGDNGVFSISISNNTASIIAQGNNSRNKLQYNGGSDIFACYSTDQTPVSIYTIQENIAWNLESISVTSNPKQTYYVGELFDPSGMVVTATYVDANDSAHTKSAEVTDYTYSPNGALSTSDNSVTISYTEGGVTKTATVSISVNARPTLTTNLEVNNLKTTFSVGESFSFGDGTVKAVYSDNSKRNLTIDDVVVSGFSSSVAVSSQSITISYTEGDITASASLSVEIVSGISYTIDFESAVSDYSDWTFTNINGKQTDSGFSPHEGTYFGVTAGTSTASIVTKNKISNPQSLTCFVSKKSTNTKASSWAVDVSTDGNTWTEVASVDGASMGKGEWVKLTAILSSYKNVFIRVYYEGSTAVRCIDDLTLLVGSATN
ncbi:MAG: bacterial Ig-like domain-containing protein [Bacteroidales bacterium]|nr:bacterial Ig-like domain-containing protein [Bacteroidales bacterium]